MIAVQKALDIVVHLPLNVNDPEVAELKELYHVRYSFPLYILCDQSGSVITRWEGYTGADRFVAKLRQSLTDLTTIEQRLARLESEPTYLDALALAQYSSGIGEFIAARDYYNQASRFGKRNFSYEVFTNVAQAATREQLPFDDALEAADSVLAMPTSQPRQVVSTVQTLTGLARVLDKTNYLGKYLESGINVSAKHLNAGFKKPHDLLMADKILYTDKDTLGAIAYKKKTLGQGWQTKAPQYYSFALWCLDRKINLEEAEMFVRKAVQKINPGASRSTVLTTLAKICQASGKKKEALAIVNQAIEEDPANEKAESLKTKWTKSHDR